MFRGFCWSADSTSKSYVNVHTFITMVHGKFNESIVHQTNLLLTTTFDAHENK